MPEFKVHFEEFLYLAGLGHDKALIAWGGFYFRQGDSPYGEWRIVDDEELAAVAPTRSETIGAGSEPFGHAIVEVERDGRVVARAETEEHNHVWVTGLEPDTEYRYRVRVDGRPWGEGELRDWSARAGDAGQRRRPVRQPLPHVPADRRRRAGDVRRARRLRRRDPRRRPRRHPAASASRRAAARGRRARRAARDHDRRQRLPRAPGHRRHGQRGRRVVLELLRAVSVRPQPRPVLPDRRQPRRRRQRELGRSRPARRQPLPRPSLPPEVEAGSASLGPGLFYRFQVGANVEFICIDTSIATGMDVEHYFDDPGAQPVGRGDAARGRRTLADPVLAPSAVLRGAGAHQHDGDGGAARTAVPGGGRPPRAQRARAQLPARGRRRHPLRGERRGRKLRPEPPRHFEQAGTRAWAAAGHFLLAHADERGVVVHPLAGVGEDGSLEPIELVDRDGRPTEPIIEIH